MLGTQQPGLRMAWLQPVLMAARQQNLVTVEKYSEAVINLIESRAHFISIDSQVLLFAAQDETDEGCKKFDRVAETLGRPDSDIESSIGVAIDFFNQIWQRSDPPIHQKAVTGKVLACIMNGRRAMFRDIAGALHDLSRSKGFRRYLILWLKGHFFPL